MTVGWILSYSTGVPAAVSYYSVRVSRQYIHPLERLWKFSISKRSPIPYQLLCPFLVCFAREVNIALSCRRRREKKDTW